MPRPESGETEKEFLKRCIPQLIKEEGYGRRQSAAICYSYYRKYGTEKASPKPNNPGKKKLSKKEKAEVYCAVCQ